MSHQLPSALCAAILVFLGLLGPAHGQDRGAIDRAAIERLHALADWCDDEKLLAERELVFRLVLKMDPADDKAHKGLGHRKSRGSWVVNERRRPKKTAKKVLEEFGAEWESRRTAVVDPIVESEIARIDAGKGSLAARHAELQDLLSAIPQHPALRSRLGEVLHDGQWRLASSVRAIARRTELLALRDRLRDELAQPKEGANPVEIDSLEIKWAGTMRCGDVRIASSNSAAEASKAAAASELVQRFCREVVACEQPLPQEFIVLLLSEKERDAFLAHPAFTPEDRALNRTLMGCWADLATVADWSDTEEKRIDAAVRQTIGRQLRSVHGLTLKQGWIWDGIGTYLGYYATGTRLTAYLKRAEYDRSTDMDVVLAMRRSNADWLKLAEQELTRQRKSRLTTMLGKDVNNLDAEDLLLGHALGAMLIEGYPDAIATVLSECGKGGKGAALVLETHMGIPSPLLESHLARWLRETQLLAGRAARR